MSLLQERGYTNVRDFTGGMQAWEEAGLPMESAPLIALTPSRAPTSGPVARPASPTRRVEAFSLSPTERLLELIDRLSFGQLFCVWLAMVAAFGLFYFALDQITPSLRDQLGGGRPGLGMATYFSFMCATSVGFGDVVPLGFARAFALIEAVTAIMLFGCVVSKLVSRKQELLTAEIHRIASEDRLGRMQMNLHMVMTELQSLEDGKETGVERLEGVAMIFASELGAVHDLLFRPQHLPTEQVLESLLARVASVMSELVRRIDGLPEDASCSATLITNLRIATTTATEICGDCVPRAHAPRVKDWMDRVQEQGRRLSKRCAA